MGLGEHQVFSENITSFNFKSVFSDTQMNKAPSLKPKRKSPRLSET